jgi:hypothetical protein
MTLSLHPDARLDEATRREVGLVSVGDSVLITDEGARRLTYEHEEWVVLGA